jgi:hypothetical protein
MDNTIGYYGMCSFILNIIIILYKVILCGIVYVALTERVEVSHIMLGFLFYTKHFFFLFRISNKKELRCNCFQNSRVKNNLDKKKN